MWKKYKFKYYSMLDYINGAGWWCFNKLQILVLFTFCKVR